MLRVLSFIACLALLIGVAHAADSAGDLMKRAHDGRAEWQDFRGFHADVEVAADGQSSKGTLRVEDDGTIRLKLANAEGFEWAERTLESVINHRLSGGAAVQNVEFADEEAKHPLGRLIKSKSAEEKSLWRVQGDVMTEVTRLHGKSRMVISVAEVYRTQEGKHLPRSFVTTTWDSESGAIQSSRQVWNEWKRIENWDLPTKLIAMINKNDGSRRVEQITLSQHWILPAKAAGKTTSADLPALTAPVTSFGAAVLDGQLYVFGGQLGSAHKYSADTQSKALLRMSLTDPQSWQQVSEGPRRTGVAMVAYRGKLYRIGGWEARNSDADKWDLHSSRDFAAYDPKTETWTDLTPLPEGRSSHDAALLGSKLYVVGGWELSGRGDGKWHETAYVCDLAVEPIAWKEIAKPPFLRRALAVAAHQDRVYVIGGMDDSNETTTEVAIYDPQSSAWSKGPALPGKGFDGFGASAFGTAAGLFASTGSGGLYRLSDDRQSWHEVTTLKHPRFFHRLVADAEGRLLFVGGTSRSGKVAEVEAIEWRTASND